MKCLLVISVLFLTGCSQFTEKISQITPVDLLTGAESVGTVIDSLTGNIWYDLATMLLIGVVGAKALKGKKVKVTKNEE